MTLFFRSLIWSSVSTLMCCWFFFWYIFHLSYCVFFQIWLYLFCIYYLFVEGCSSTLLCSLVNIFMIITLNSSLGMLLISVSLSFSEVLTFSFTQSIFFGLSFCLTWFLWFRCDSCFSWTWRSGLGYDCPLSRLCVPGDFGWLELYLEWVGLLGHSVLGLPLKWACHRVVLGLSTQRVPCRTAEDEVSASWSVLDVSAQGALAGPLTLKWMWAGPWVLCTEGALARLPKLKWGKLVCLGVLSALGAKAYVVHGVP